MLCISVRVRREFDMAHTRASSHSQGQLNLSFKEAGTAQDTGLKRAARGWPVIVIVVGLLASAAWTAGLIYGAYLLARWALG